jgi:hypothetical protein
MARAGLPVKSGIQSPSERHYQISTDEWMVFIKAALRSWVLCSTPVIPTFRRLLQGDLESEATLGYKVRPCLQKIKATRIAERKQFRILSSSTCIFRL